MDYNLLRTFLNLLCKNIVFIGYRVSHNEIISELGKGKQQYRITIDYGMLKLVDATLEEVSVSSN